MDNLTETVPNALLLEHESIVMAAIAQYADEPGALLPILHAVQQRIGFIPPASLPLIAQALRQTEAEIHGVVSFYHDFNTAPHGKKVIKFCRAEACQARGARALEQHVKDELAIDFHQTTANNEFTLLPVYCLGNCTSGPSVSVDDKLYSRVDEFVFSQIIAVESSR